MRMELGMAVANDDDFDLHTCTALVLQASPSYAKERVWRARLAEHRVCDARDCQLESISILILGHTN